MRIRQPFLGIAIIATLAQSTAADAVIVESGEVCESAISTNANTIASASTTKAATANTIANTPTSQATKTYTSGVTYLYSTVLATVTAPTSTRHTSTVTQIVSAKSSSAKAAPKTVLICSIADPSLAMMHCGEDAVRVDTCQDLCVCDAIGHTISCSTKGMKGCSKSDIEGACTKAGCGCPADVVP